MTAPQAQDGLSLDERIRRAEREVMLHDRLVMQRLDQVTQQTRSAARPGGRGGRRLSAGRRQNHQRKEGIP